ncbi:MAG TPA: ATP-binding protein, partial [Thermoanaerobaculia bacterium]|nr:ATP-binding protein [Thermoanaerobaculia bacterium]
IPEETLQRIFDMHYTTKTTGTGIGLYVARSIVEAHGGEIRVENLAGRGSEFRLRLPALGQGR